MIKNSFYKQIISSLEKSGRFEGADFRIDSQNESNTYSGTPVKLKIYLLSDPKYYYSVDIPSKLSSNSEGYYYSFSGKCCPGPLAFIESFSFSTTKSLLESIAIWVDNIWLELTHNPVVQTILNKQQQVEDLLETYSNIEDTYFKEDEIIDVKQRLDNLEASLSNDLKQAISDKKQLEIELNNLKNDIETLKQTVAAFKKKGWFKSFSTKVFKWTKNGENRKLLKDGYQVLKEFLPEEYKNNLPK